MKEAANERVAAQVLQLDLFFPIPDFSDIALRDYGETMQRPFFSLAKSKRVKPIEYTSPDGTVSVTVTANPSEGMATIWDADILIFLISALHEEKRAGKNDLTPVFRIHPAHLLARIGRDTSGAAYQRLLDALDRLQTTTVKTNIRARANRETVFSWIDGYTHLVDEKGRSLGMEISLSRWLYDGALADTAVLAIPPTYFSITSGMGRWLWRVARKHAGGNGDAGFAISLKTLHQKSGSERVFRQFKSDLLALARKNDLPGLDLSIEGDGDSQRLRMRMIAKGESQRSTHSRIVHINKCPTPAKPIVAGKRDIDDQALSLIKRDCPGWDMDVMQEQFNAWIGSDPRRLPRDYGAAFASWMRTYHQRNKHTLPGLFEG
jgi:plasmid replication initiation protein